MDSMTSSNHESEPSVPSKGWILYDGGCGFCFRWVHCWEKVVAGRGFALKDLQSAYSDGSLQISQENLLDDIQVLTRAGIGCQRIPLCDPANLVGMAFLRNL